MKILANDGISPAGVDRLTEAGFEVVTDKIPQEKLIEGFNAGGFEILLVRSATKVGKDVIDNCSKLKLVGRGGVGLDNIDVSYARSHNVDVVNTPSSSSQSVAELVFAHLFSLARMTYDSNRQMPLVGNTEFKDLKKKYGKGSELRGKTMGIIGFGRIGKATAAYALGCGMNVLAFDVYDVDTKITLEIPGAGKIFVDVKKVGMEELLSSSDYISLHVPKQGDGSAVISSPQFAQMKEGVFVVNASRGGVIDEEELIKALDSGKVAGAALDVYDNEPTPRESILKHPKIALTPHIGAATEEAQERIGLEMADIIIGKFGKN